MNMVTFSKRGGNQLLDVYYELGQKRVFACAIDWPGWCRSGKDEESALQALLDYGLRYQQALKSANLAFTTPTELSDFTVAERLEGDATTDFGAPAAVPDADRRPVGNQDLQSFRSILKACWQAFEKAVDVASGKELRKGPRGGGRELDRIFQHVLDAQAGYLTSLGWKYKLSPDGGQSERLAQIRQAVIEGLEASARGELPEKGIRGGARWTPRYFVRRSAWHLLDHAWEIEDRMS